MSSKSRWIDRFLNHKIEIAKTEVSVLNLLFLVCIFMLSIVMKSKLFPIMTADFTGSFDAWMNTIRTEGLFASLSHKISDYPVSYLYFLALLTHISSNNLMVLKFSSIFFETVSAVAVFMILMRLTKSVNKSVFGAALTAVAPIVILDGAFWGQCDSLYTALILLALYFFFKEDSNKFCIFIGLAFCFKVQTLFLFPFILIMWAKNKVIKLVHLLWIPGLYFVSIIPAWIAGRSFKDLISVFWSQANFFPAATLNYPNIYTLMGETQEPSHLTSYISEAGLLLAIIVLGFVAYYIVQKKFIITDNIVITTAILTIGLAVYFLPHMHDRYGYLLDILSIIYVVLRPRKFPVFAGFSLVSVMCCIPYLMCITVIPFAYQAIFLGGLLVYIGMDLYNQINEQSEEQAAKHYL